MLQETGGGGAQETAPESHQNETSPETGEKQLYSATFTAHRCLTACMCCIVDVLYMNSGCVMYV